MSPQKRIESALKIAVEMGGVDGSHHKAWVIDQMVRALTGCPEIRRTDTDFEGKPFEYVVLGESDEYKRLVRDACTDDDGTVYPWETGIAP